MTEQWDFVYTAYALTALGTGALLVTSWLKMRNAETRAASVGRDSDA